MRIIHKETSTHKRLIKIRIHDIQEEVIRYTKKDILLKCIYIAHGSIFSYGISMNFTKEKNKNLKNITTNTKGTNASWDTLRKATSSKRKDSKQFQQYCTWEYLEELICNKLLEGIFGIGESWTWFYILPIICIISNYSHKQ